MSSKSTSPASTVEAESILSRTLFGPILFVSFIVSLFFVDEQASAGIFESSARMDPKHEHQHYYHSHQRKLAKKEFDDAFAPRKRLIAAICVAAGMILAVLGWFLSKAWAIWGYHPSTRATAM